ncbi:MAG: ZIP family metal transporter [Legionellaceae bacterium]|nr:ZIP family metal transporter [Legionellaceae bacterium]
MVGGDLKLFFSLSIFIVIIIAGWYPFKKRLKNDHADFPIGETLATGVFLGAALLHLLPEADSMLNKMGYKYPFAYLLCGLTFLIFLWFEHLGKELYQHKNSQHPSFALLAWIMLSIHSLVLATALGFSDNYSIAIMLYLAIITHKWAESFAISVQLNKSSLPNKINVILFTVFSLMTPVGVYLGWYLEHEFTTNSMVDPILVSVSAGTFLYLGTLHGLERCVMVQRCCNLKYFSFVIIGFLLMASVALYT